MCFLTINFSSLNRAFVWVCLVSVSRQEVLNELTSDLVVWHGGPSWPYPDQV